MISPWRRRWKGIGDGACGASPLRAHGKTGDLGGPLLLKAAIQDPGALLDHATAALARRPRTREGNVMPERGSRTVSAFAWRSLCQMPLCVVGVELGLLRE
jgi:hypothetical protein